MRLAIGLALLVLAGCQTSPAKDADGHVVGTPMGNAAPRYAAGEPFARFLAGRWTPAFANAPDGTETSVPGLEIDESMTFEERGKVRFELDPPGHARAWRDGTWRLQGDDLVIAFDSKTESASPEMRPATEGASETFTSPLRIDDDGRRLKFVSPAAPDGDTPDGKFVWRRVWPAPISRR